MTRRAVCAGMAALAAPGAAGAAKAARSAVPGGGSVLIPSPFRPVAASDYFHEPDAEALIAYRNRRYRASGSAECDGMIAVALTTRHASLAAFELKARAALTTSWAFADRQPAPWGEDRGSFPLVLTEGPEGPEATRELALHLVGWFGTYAKPARFYARESRAGIRIGVWIFDSHGGIARARTLAAAIAATYAP